MKYEDQLLDFSTQTQTKRKRTKYGFSKKYFTAKCSFCPQEFPEVTSKFTKIKFQKSSEESVEKGDEVKNEYKAGAWLFLYCTES